MKIIYDITPIKLLNNNLYIISNITVSYTHLDVYKRQPLFFALVMFLVLPIEIGHTYDSILLCRVPCHIILTRRPA